MWVRPALTSSENSSALRSKAPARRSRAGSRRSRASSTAARWTAEGKTSFDDWPMFTWSLAWASSPARLAITSFAFMFDEVPEPVWKTSIGNWSSCSPFATSSPAFATRSARSASSSPSSAFARAAAAFSLPSQWITGAGIGWPEVWKFSTALDVSPPHRSVRVAMHAGYLPRLAPGDVAAPAGALEACGQCPACIAEAGGGVEAPHEVGVDRVGSLADRAEQVTELEGCRPRGVTPGFRVELG